MGIGAIGAYGSVGSILNSYNINSVYGNPKSMQAVQKIGEDDYSGNPFAILSEKQDVARIKEQQEKPFDYEAAFERAKNGMTTTAGEQQVDIGSEMERMMQGSRFSAATIPVADLLFQ